jgi:hypothetical protein
VANENASNEDEYPHQHQDERIDEIPERRFNNVVDGYRVDIPAPVDRQHECRDHQQEQAMRHGDQRLDPGEVTHE